MISTPVVVAAQTSDLAEDHSGIDDSIESIDTSIHDVENIDGPRPVVLDRTSNNSMMHARSDQRDDPAQHKPNPRTDYAVTTAAQLHLQREAVPPKAKKAHP